MDLELNLSCLGHPSFYIDDQFRLLSVNPKGQTWLGLRQDSEIIDWSKGRALSLKLVLDRALSTGQSQQDVLMWDQDGAPKSLLILVQVIQKSEKRFLWAQIIALNNENLEKLNQEAVRSTERVSLALRSRQVGFWEWDIRENILIWDKTQFEIFGVDPRDFKNTYQAWEATLAPESREKANHQVRLALEGKQNYNTEYEIVTTSGEKRIIRGSAVCQRDENGNAYRMVGLNWDVTHRRKMETQILEHGRFTRKITDMIPTFIAIRSIALDKLTYFNRRLPEMLDYKMEDFTDIPAIRLAEMIHPDDRQSFIQLIRTTPFMADEEIKELEVRATTAKGRPIWVHLRSKVFERDIDGKPVSIITAGTDFTEKKHLEMEAEAGRARAFNSSKLAALGEMAGGIAHEINNPLTIIVAKIEQVRKKLVQLDVSETQIFEDIDRIQSVCQRIAKIIRSMRALARTEDGEACQPILISTLLEEVLILCHQRFSQLDIRFEMGNPPAITAELRQIQVSQIILNLLNNAIDAVEALPERWIRIDFQYDDEFLRILITDSGQGIHPDIAKRMNEPFFTTKEVGKGTGLGLSISQAIAERHHGSLQYDPTSPNTRFILSLPRRQLRKD